jgi:lysophospholipase L1-like esterase
MVEHCRSRCISLFVISLALLQVAGLPPLLAAPPQQKWVTVWTASVHGPYPSGNASAQPNLSFVFDSPLSGARDQSFRLIVRPDLWGRRVRFRLSNAMGTRPVTFDGAYVALQLSGSAIVPGTNQPVLFGGKPAVTISPGESGWSDPVELAFVRDRAAISLQGRKLAVSFHIAGESGPMTWHAKALTTSYITPPGAGSKGREESEGSFPFPTTSWYFLDAVDMMAPDATRVIVAFGDSITDGTASTLNGDDRWPDVLSRRLNAAYGDRVAVVNAGIGGNRILGPTEYSPQKPSSGGPSAGARLERDVLSLSGVSAVIWLEGINDFSNNANATESSIQTGMTEIVKRIRAAIPGVRIIGATLTSALGASGAHGSRDEDQKRQALNDFIRAGGLFDGVADFDKATLDPQTGGLLPSFVPESTTGGPGDKLHPSRLGYLAMGTAIDLRLLMP